MWLNAPDRRSGGACVGLGKYLGSYRWYVWMIPPMPFGVELVIVVQEGRASSDGVKTASGNASGRISWSPRSVTCVW